MNLLLDTHIALWAITDSPRLSLKARELILSPRSRGLGECCQSMGDRDHFTALDSACADIDDSVDASDGGDGGGDGGGRLRIFGMLA